LTFLVFGFTEFAAPLPAAVLRTGCVMVTYLWLVICLILAFLFLLREKSHAFFISIVGMTVSALLFFVLMVVPSVNPYGSTKQLS
jgi:hypothetical protein